MKKQFGSFCVVALMVLSFVVALQAAETSRLLVTVPFAFQAGSQSLPAGQYIVEIGRLTQGSALGSSLVLRTRDDKLRHRVVSVPGYASRLTSGANLVFHRYGDTYFLAQVDSYGLECQLRRSPAEKEMAAKLNRNAEIVTAAAE